MPGFQRVYEAHRERGFTIVGLSTDVGGTGPVRDFLVENGITYPVAMANASVVRDFGGANLLPTSYLIDRDGRFGHTVRRDFAAAARSRAVANLIAEDGPTTYHDQSDNTKIDKMFKDKPESEEVR